MIARTLTGSVAEISAPKAKLSARLSDVMSSKIPPKLKIRDPIITADINVPTNAYIMIAPKLLKKGFLSMLYPLSKIIGGNRNSRKNSTLS
jgi:hypothetical protein